MKIDVQGQKVEVDDSFAQMSPAEQSATVDDIAKQLNLHAEVKQEVEAEAAKEPSAAVQFAQEHPTTAGVASALATPISAAANLMAQHPLETAGIGFGAYKANKVANAYLSRAQMAAEAQHAQAAAAQAQAQADLLAEQGRANRFDIRRGATPRPVAPAGAPVTPSAGYGPTTMNAPTFNAPPTAQPVAPQGPATNAIRGAQAAQQGENWMAKAMQMAKQVGPVMQQYGGRAAQAVAPVARAVAPALELAARYNPAIVGIQAATHTGGLNANEEEELRRRRAMAPTITR